jgi:hypothetical protein
MTDSEKYKSFDDIKCLWMKCGAVEYKLCDKNFDCENCSFDKQMMTELKLKGSVNEEIENIFGIGKRTLSFAHPYYHFHCGLTARNLLANNYYMGLEPFIANFIDKNSLLKYCSPKRSIKKGEPILNISNGWGEVNVLSPFNFHFVEKLEVNKSLMRGFHWFAIIEAERYEILGNSINKKHFFDKLYETKLNLLNLMRTSDSAGNTMYDGGKIIENWSDILGKHTYRNLLEKLFSNV